MITNDINLVEFINLIPKLNEGDTFVVKTIYELDDGKDKPFLKWPTSDSDQICMDCGGCFVDESDKHCKKKSILYYVDQHSSGEDSFHGTLVYPLSDCYVEVVFSC